jgi:hypothetical protein
VVLYGVLGCHNERQFKSIMVRLPRSRCRGFAAGAVPAAEPAAAAVVSASGVTLIGAARESNASGLVAEA